MIHAHSGTAKIWSTQQIEIAEDSFVSCFFFPRDAIEVLLFSGITLSNM
jgi:hypothetical protein